MDTPGYRKPTHVYGTESGDWDLSAPVADGAQLSAEVPDDNWAGEGFIHHYREPAQEVAGEVPGQGGGLA